VAATAAVIVLPIGLVSLLVSDGLAASIFVTGPVAMLVSLAVSSGGSAWWKKRPGAHDLVFSDLMIWGWLRRMRTERRISRTVELLGNGAQLPTDRQIEYFKELAGALEARDPYTHGHTRRVTGHAVAIAERMGLTREQITKVRTAAAIHDIGKLKTPREVLNKPGRLTDEEFAVIKRHPVDGAEMAARLGDGEITGMVLHHHERLDGTGYPGELAGDEIPLGARIIAVADTFDAITSKRPYRGVSSHKKGMAILAKEAGTQLDPDAVRAFQTHYSGLRGIAVVSRLSSGPGQLLPWRWGLGSAMSTAKTVATVAVAGILGTTAAGLAKAPAHAPSSHSRALRLAAASPPRASGLLVSRSARPFASHPRLPSRRRGSVPVRRTPHHSPSGRPTTTPDPGAGTTSAPAGVTTAPAGHGAPTSSSSPASSPQGSGSSSSGGKSSGGDGSTSSGVPVTLPASTPPVTATTPAATVSTPSVTVSTPTGPVKTPPATVSTPSLTVTTPPVQTGPPSLP
jgi:putative nucleotidyltransferase with HDIG domain